MSRKSVSGCSPQRARLSQIHESLLKSNAGWPVADVSPPMIGRSNARSGRNPRGQEIGSSSVLGVKERQWCIMFVCLFVTAGSRLSLFFMHGLRTPGVRGRSTRQSTPWLRLLCLFLVLATCVAAVHTHQDSHLDCAKHCPSCASFHSAPALASVSIVRVSFSVVDTVVNSRPHVASVLFSYSLYIRPPPAA